MTIENDFLAFATAGLANVLTQAQYVADTSVVQNGFTAGVVPSNAVNKVWRQSSIIASMIAQFIVDQSGQPAIDDGTTATLEANLLTAIRNAAKTGVILADTGAVNAYTAVNAPPLVAGTWVDGVVQQVKIAHTNTGASTYAPDGLTAIPIYGLGLQPLQGGELSLNGTAVLMHATIAGVNSGNPIAVLMECAGGAQQIAPAVASQHAAQLGQLNSMYGARGLVANNNATTPLTKFDVSATLAVLRNPTTGALVAVALPVTTCDVTAAGPVANGRDQSGAFSASSWLHFYLIWNGATLATIASANTPSTGPTLPSGYTHWGYVGAIYFNASSQLVKTHIRGANAFYDSYVSAVAGAGNTTETLITLSTVVPPNAVEINLFANVGLTTNSSGIAGSNLALRVISGSDFERLTLSVAVANQTAWNASSLRIPNIGQQAYFIFENETSPANIASRAAYIDITGYTLPNGA